MAFSSSMLMGVNQGAPSHTYATWSPALTTANGILSNGNLTFSVNNAPNPQFPSTIATIGKSSGKWYWEMYVASTWHLSDFTNTWAFFWWVTDQAVAFSESSPIADSAHWWGFRTFNYNNGSNSPPYAWHSWGHSWVYNQVTNWVRTQYTWWWSFALDMDNWTLEVFRTDWLWNRYSVGIDSLFTWLSWTFYPAINFYPTYVHTTTANFWATPFQFTPPVWFNAWLYI